MSKLMELALVLHNEVGVTCGNSRLLAEAVHFMILIRSVYSIGEKPAIDRYGK